MTLSVLILAICFIAPAVKAQTDNSPVSTQFSDPTGKACASGTGAIYALTGTLYTCQSGIFALASVSSGGLAPFTTDGTSVYLTSGNLSIQNTVPPAGAPVGTMSAPWLYTPNPVTTWLDRDPSLIAQYDFVQGAIATNVYNIANRGPRANLLIPSNDWTAAAWIKLGGTTVASKAFADPSDSVKMDQLTGTTGGPLAYKNITGLTIGLTYTFSVEVSVPTSTTTLYLKITDSSDHNSPLFTVTPTRQRFSLSYAPNTANPTFTIAGNVAGSTINVRAAMVVPGAVPLSYEETPYSDGTIANGATFTTAGLPLNGTNQTVSLSGILGSLNHDEGSLIVTASVANAGVWTDGVRRTLVSLVTNSANKIEIVKPVSPTNAADFIYAAGTSGAVEWTGVATTGPITYGLTWSKSADTMAAYVNGIKIGSVAGLGAWTGALFPGYTNIGYSGSGYFSGTVSHAAFYSRALSSDEMFAKSRAVPRTVAPLPIYGKLIAFIGDSILGNPAGLQSLQYPSYAANALVAPYVNKGIGGQTTTQIAARYDTDVLALNPSMVVLGGGLNDISAAAPCSTITANFGDMLAKNQARAIQSVVVLMTPLTSQTNTFLLAEDDCNIQLKTTAQSYNAIIVDPRPVIGQYRSAGSPTPTAGNLWDFQAGYDDGSGLHLSAKGAQIMGQEVARVIALALKL